MENQTSVVQVQRVFRAIDDPEVEETKHAEEIISRAESGWLYEKFKALNSKLGSKTFPTAVEIGIEIEESGKLLVAYGTKLYLFDFQLLDATEIPVEVHGHITSIKKWGHFKVITANHQHVVILKDSLVTYRTVNLLHGSKIDSVKLGIDYLYFKNPDSKLVRVDKELNETTVDEDDQHYTGFVPEAETNITCMNYDGFLRRNGDQIYQVPAGGLGRELYKTSQGRYLACFGDNSDQGIWLLETTLSHLSTWSYKGSLPPIDHLYIVPESAKTNILLVQTAYKWYILRESQNRLELIQELRLPSEATVATVYGSRILLSGPQLLADAAINLPATN